MANTQNQALQIKINLDEEGSISIEPYNVELGLIPIIIGGLSNHLIELSSLLNTALNPTKVKEEQKSNE